ncbi:MAG: D-alanyl-D-alanine carboxypeptidase [Lachnospiraceae bacterium]|nr:D-alanyl-D-alanine carboxypeptidase [Lachnospiraceae bacterium]
MFLIYRKGAGSSGFFGLCRTLPRLLLYALAASLCLQLALLFPFSGSRASASGEGADLLRAKTKAQVDEALDAMPKNWPAAPEIGAETAIVLEKNSGAVLYAKNATETHYPASVTKILTALMVCERLPMNSTITMSRTAVETLTPGASNIALNVGEEISVEDALYAVMLPSANEAANGLAEAAAGSIEDFTVEMNERCRELGTVNTRFVNVNGLHDENHYSCAYDLALIFAECVDNPTFLQIAHSYNHIIPPTNKQKDKRAIKTTDKMMNPYEKEYYSSAILAGKTGHTPEAGHNLVSYVSQGGLELIIVVMGAEDEAMRYADTKALMNYSLSNFSVANISKYDTTYGMINGVSTTSPVTIPKKNLSLFSLDTNDYVLLPSGAFFEDLTSSLSYIDGQNSGAFAVITYYYNGYSVGDGHLILTDNSLTKLTDLSFEDNLTVDTTFPETESAAETETAGEGKKTGKTDPNGKDPKEPETKNIGNVHFDEVSEEETSNPVIYIILALLGVIALVAIGASVIMVVRDRSSYYSGPSGRGAAPRHGRSGPDFSEISRNSRKRRR